MQRRGYGRKENSWSNPRVVTEFTDSLGRVRFGYTRNTLAVLDADRVQVFGPSDGLRVGNIMAIYGRGSQIWIGGEFGLQQFDHGRFHEIHATNKQWLRGISGIVEISKGLPRRHRGATSLRIAPVCRMNGGLPT